MYQIKGSEFTVISHDVLPSIPEAYFSCAISISNKYEGGLIIKGLFLVT